MPENAKVICESSLSDAVNIKAKLIPFHEVPQLWAHYSPWKCNLGGLFLADNNPIGAMVPVAVSHTLFEISLQCNNRITFYFIHLFSFYQFC